MWEPVCFPPAPPGTFRLFRLLSLFPTPTIHLQTFPYPQSSGEQATDTVHPSQCPPYDAISYAWNPESSAHPPETAQMLHPLVVQMYGQTSPVALNITAHLLYGLLTVQQLQAPTWLFVDAICIDQTDVRDKAVQVQNIHRVFNGAERVLVWLGDGGRVHLDGGSDADLTKQGDLDMNDCFVHIPELIRTLETCLGSSDQVQTHAPADDHNLQNDDKQATIAIPSMALAALPPPSSSLWSALRRLRLNSWFSRLWGFQEICLSNKTILVCDQNSLPWDTYVRLTSLCEKVIRNLSSKQQTSERANRLRLIYNNHVTAIAQLQAILVRRQTARPGNDPYKPNQSDDRHIMSAVLRTIRKLEVTLPLDRVYSIMGLLGTEMQEAIHVDYSKVASKQYWMKWMELCQAMLTFVPDFAEELLSSTSFLEPHADLPSWCPNLADNVEIQPIVLGSEDCAGMPGGERWKNETNDRTVTVILGTRSLAVLGITVDEVAQVIDLGWIEYRQPWFSIFISQDVEVDADVAQEITATLWQCLTEMSKRGVSAKYGDAVLARCLIANAYDGRVVDSTQLQRDYLAFMRFLEHYTWGPAPGEKLKASTRTAALRFGKRFLSLVRKRAFLVTVAGRSGLCSNKARVGDDISVLMNFQAPYLLRRCSAKGVFDLVGEAYVDGIMRGEVFTGRDMTIEKPEMFVIS